MCIKNPIYVRITGPNNFNDVNSVTATDGVAIKFFLHDLRISKQHLKFYHVKNIDVFYTFGCARNFSSLN